MNEQVLDKVVKGTTVIILFLIISFHQIKLPRSI